MGVVVKNKVPDVYVIADNIASPLGKTTEANFNALKAGETGVKLHADRAIADEPFFASLFDRDEIFANGLQTYTRFERLIIASVEGALHEGDVDAAEKKTVLIISTTKGNISLLETNEENDELISRVSLSASAKLIAAHFGFQNNPIIISNACISGVLAIITGMRLLRSGQYETAVIVGADVISEFVVSGFQSFQALSKGICKPFDSARDGLNLGEGAGTMILSTDKKYRNNVKVLGGSVSNDANHISAPSRTGQELAYAINKTLKDAHHQAEDINFISAHGTATVYNDEMEAAAITITGLANAPLNSLKGNYGHTLGAAGLIESIISIQSLKHHTILPTLGYNNIGVTNAVNVCSSLLNTESNNFLKTASGFGGCNAAVLFGRE